MEGALQNPGWENGQETQGHVPSRALVGSGGQEDEEQFPCEFSHWAAETEASGPFLKVCWTPGQAGSLRERVLGENWGALGEIPHGKGGVTIPESAQKTRGCGT